jgi:hypothetical protein
VSGVGYKGGRVMGLEEGWEGMGCITVYVRYSAR